MFAGARLSYAVDRLAKLSIASCAQVSIAKQDFATYKNLSEDLQKNIEQQNDLISQLGEFIDKSEDKLKDLQAQNDFLSLQITIITSQIKRFGINIKNNGDTICLKRMSRHARSHQRESALREVYLPLVSEKTKDLEE